MIRFLLLLALLATPLILVGCDARSAPPQEATEPITDTAFLTGDAWNDGQAEVAFYQIERTQNQYGEEAEQSFLVGTYLVKHDFDPAAMAKARADAEEAVSAFKYALFYEFESGSYQYKRNYVINAAQADLTPLKASFTSFDWCSNRYRELAFQPDGTVDHLMRSDDYGNSAGSFDYQAHAYPVEAIPVLIRGLDFAEKDEHLFSIVLPEGDYVQARARLDGTDTMDLESGSTEAERIVVMYDTPVPSLIGEETDESETYWRGTDPLRLLLKVESATGRYNMTLVEELRTPYWNENLWPRLERVTTRP
ncbi:MAG TPA: hypothetical protein VKP65_04240 [Rhodothermales bacterium]|nr:hypothetical protein [Rhodothermales bacterium]